jgi:hypothetical protein
MLDVFGFPSPQQANYQEFYGGGTTRDWVKPRGASMVRFMLIGAGGGGGIGSATVGAGGGGSGAVTSWIGPAMFVPDILRIVIGAGGSYTAGGGFSYVIYQAKDGTGYTLLTAEGGNSGAAGAITAGGGGSATTANYFSAAGIFNSIAGEGGAAGNATGAGSAITASATTFLSGGAGGSGAAASTGGSVTPNYGYLALPSTTAGGLVAGADGYFITQPILVGTGGAGGTTSTVVGSSGGKGGIGCGGGGSGEDATTVSGNGGDGAVFVWSW